MQHDRKRSTITRWSGMAAIGSGLAFGATIAYLFGVLPRAGFTFAMLDDRASLLPWLAQHARLYGGLWLLYFISQALLLPLPGALVAAYANTNTRGSGVIAICAKLGYAAILLAIVGLVLVYTTSPLVASAYIRTPGDSAAILLLGDLFADTGKEIRLFSEVLLGLWLLGTAATLLQRSRSVLAPWAMLAIGAYTEIVAVIKISDPLTPLEDTLGLFLALVYGAIGAMLVQHSRMPEVDDRPVSRSNVNLTVPEQH